MDPVAQRLLALAALLIVAAVIVIVVSDEDWAKIVSAVTALLGIIFAAAASCGCGLRDRAQGLRDRVHALAVAQDRLEAAPVEAVPTATLNRCAVPTPGIRTSTRGAGAVARRFARPASARA
jgi:hypothetical protein